MIHGTYSGYASHYRRGERPCMACRAAKNRYRREWRRIRRLLDQAVS